MFPARFLSVGRSVCPFGGRCLYASAGCLRLVSQQQLLVQCRVRGLLEQLECQYIHRARVVPQRLRETQPADGQTRRQMDSDRETNRQTDRRKDGQTHRRTACRQMGSRPMGGQGEKVQGNRVQTDSPGKQAADRKDPLTSFRFFSNVFDYC